MPNDLIAEPLIARHFQLDVDGIGSFAITGVEGMNIEIEVITVTQNMPSGIQQHIKTRGGAVTTPNITITRLAPLNAHEDKIWQWFLSIRDGGLTPAQRKNGSIILKGSILDEVGRFNFFGGWPSSLTTAGFDAESAAAIKETIVLSVDRFERVK